MKKISKNLLSMALVIAMVLSLMPMSFAAGGDVPTDVKIVYDIVSRVGNWGDTADKPFTEATYESTNGFWNYDSNITGTDYLQDNLFTTNSAQGLYINGKGTWWAVKINVPKTATYTPSLSYTTHKNNKGFQVYLASVDEYATPGAAILNVNILEKEDGTTKIALGEFNTVQETKTAVFSKKEIQAGEYYLIYCNDNYTGWRIAGNFTLTEGNGDGSALMGGKISGVADELEIGDTATAAASAFLSMDGSVAGNFTYSSDSSAITINANTGALTAETAGSATITATSADAVEGCNTITKTITVTAPKGTDVKIVYDIVSRVGNWGDTADKPFTEATYESTNGFWNYDSNSTETDYLQDTFLTNPAQGLYINGKGTWWAVKINVPKTTTYTPSLSYTTHKNNKGFQVYLASVDEYATPGAAISNGTPILKKEDGTTIIALGEFNGDQETKTAVFSKQEIQAGEYYLIYCNDNYTGWRIAGNFTLTEGNGNGNALMGGKISGVADELEIGDTATAAASAFLSMDGSVAGNFTYSSDSSAIIINANTGALTAETAGSATITATSADAVEGCNTITKTVKVNPEQDPDLTDAFNDAVETPINDYIAPTVTTITINGVTDVEPALQANGSYRIEAPATNAEGKAFLYWAKAMSTNEKIVSLSNIVYYVPEEYGRNILAAVYEGDVNLDAPKCYNANGQYLPDAEPIEADLPSMAGYGTATEWVQYKNTNIYVAQYAATEPTGDFNVHITGGDGDNEHAKYAELITCETTDAHKQQYGQYFKYWKRVDTDGTETIVSRDEEYSFRAWESCEIKGIYSNDPVYYTGSVLKILIDSFTIDNGVTGVMAEFLGLGNNVVEKGIMFNNERIAMTTVGNQFSVIADEDGTYKGYVIVDNGDDGYTLITDGQFVKGNN